MTKIIEIEGIGPAYAEKMKAAGVATVEKLLDKGGTPEGRKTLAKKSGISPKLIMRWVNHADLYRIKGVARQYSELLELAGVDTVVELAGRNAENLTAALAKANEEKKCTDTVPALVQVQAWIEEAKTLPRKVSY